MRAWFASLSQSVSKTEVVLFTKHMAVMTKAGIPIAEALALLVDQVRSRALKTITRQISQQVDSGLSLSEAMAKFPHVFSHFHQSMVAVGEKTGNLDDSFEFLAQQLTKEHQLRKKIQSALLYPAIVLIGALILGGMIAFFILPQLAQFFEALDVELPWSTQLLLWIANTLQKYGLIIGVALVLGGIGGYILLHSKPVVAHWDRFKLWIPVLGPMMANYQYAHLTRSWGVLLQSGLPMGQSFEILIKTIDNQRLIQDLHFLSEQISSGESLGVQMESNQVILPKLMAKMVQVGEESGKLDETLQYLGDFYENELDLMSKNVASLLEPLLLLGIGLFVGFITLAIITPIYDLTGSIGQ